MRREWRSLAELVATRAQQAPERLAFRFLSRLGDVESTLTYGELDRSARTVGSLLLDSGLARRHVLLLLPPGLSFVTSLFGCFYAGSVAVPAYPPPPARIAAALERLATLARDAGVKGVLTTPAILEATCRALADAPSLKELTWLVLESDPGDEGAWIDVPVAPGDLALLQYTSGSTRSPRGVMLTHENLLDNSAFIHRAFGHSSESHGVIWLPPYHDMGLMGGIVQPVYGGFPCTLMAPLDFFRRPVLWLQAITRFCGTTSGGPNFAYERCLRRIGAEQREGLDLGSWQVAFNGAETVSAKTLSAFAAEFASCGFSASALVPCYGLAEATLAVTCGAARVPPTVETFRAAALEEDRVEMAPAGGPGVRLVGCGRPHRPGAIAIADPETLEPVSDGRVGEIWVRGPSVARGYWGRATETGRVFHARLGDHGGTFMRTGDLGFLHREELFVTGRLKEVLVVRGRKYYPQDVEAFTRGAHGALERGRGAAFTIEGALSERLVVVHEVEWREPVDTDTLVRSIRRAVASGMELQLHAIALVRPGTIPTTTSGKIQRARCRTLFLERRLETFATWSLEGAPESSSRRKR